MLTHMLHVQNEIKWAREEKEAEAEALLLMEMEERYSQHLEYSRYIEVYVVALFCAHHPLCRVCRRRSRTRWPKLQRSVLMRIGLLSILDG